MAYMNQEKKAKIAAELKKVMPKDWKYSLGVQNHSTIVLTILAGPEVLAINPGSKEFCNYRMVNNYYPKQAFISDEIGETFVKIIQTLNLDNFDESEPMTDYFHVGHYVSVNIGRWNKPYKVI